MPLGLVRVGSSEKNPSHDIELWDGIRAIGLRLDGGPRGVQEIPQTPSTLKFSGGGTKFGDWEPGMSHIQQSSWIGGMGQEQFSEDDSRFLDSDGAYTLVPNKLISGGMVFGEITGSASGVVPGGFANSMNVLWKPLTGTTRYYARTFTGPAGGYNADFGRALIRRIGSPGTLTFEIQTDSASAPSGTALKSVAKTISDVPDFVSTYLKFDWSSTQAIGAGTVYWIVIYGASTDNHANHWEIATNDENSTNNSYSTAGVTWTNNTYTAYMYVKDAEIARKTIYFELDSQLYGVSNDGGGGAAQLYINGWRGKATAGGAATITDTNQTFLLAASMSHWKPVVKIINGTGAGQVRRYASSTTTEITVTPNWDITPDTTSEYVVLGTGQWTELTGHGLTKPVTSVCVSSFLPGVAYLAQGSGTTMRRFRFDATAGTPAHTYAADGTNQADLLFTFYDQSSKTVQIWRALNSTTNQLSRAPAQAWGTDLTFGTGIPAGNKQYMFMGLEDYDGILYVAKEDSLWRIENDTPIRENVGLGSSPHPENGQAIKSLGLFLFFNFMHSVERLYGKTLDDLNPMKAEGFAGKTGVVSALTTAFNWLFVAIDAGTSGTSSVLCYDGTGWHVIYRAFEAGIRIRNIWWQAVPRSFPRLWISMNGYSVFIQFPQDTLNPLNDSAMNYRHESVIIGSTIDLDSFSLPKFIKERTAVTKNLSAGTEVRTDYQLDENIGTSTWTPLGTYYQSPIDVITAGFGNIRQVRFRDRLITDSSTTPAVVRATVMEGYARTPLKYQYNMRVITSDFQVNYLGARDSRPDEVVRFLKNAARGARKIIMRSRFSDMDNLVVIVEPPSILREFYNSILQFWGGKMTIVVREA